MENGLNCVCNGVFYDMGNVLADSRSAVVSSICIIDVCTSNRYCANIGVHDIRLTHHNSNSTKMHDIIRK